MKDKGFVTLYKYLDIEGGMKMLQNSNLQFTNANKFNDPFDCHPALFDYSNVPTNKNNWPPADFLQLKGVTDMENLRNSIWISCLSKVYDSLLMWTYYNSHKGICIGLNVEAVIKICRYKFFGLMSPFALEVKYKELSPKPDYFKNYTSGLELLTTKAKAWEHEQEVRLITKDPAWVHEERNIPKEFKDDEIVDWKEIRHYPHLTSECFESVYLGVNMHPRNKNRIIDTAKKLNREIKIYQMTIDPEAFKLKAEIIES